MTRTGRIEHVNDPAPLLRCGLCGWRGTRAQLTLHPRQGFGVCPPCWRKGVERIPDEPEPKTDGLGNALIPEAMYFLQDARTCVGNCGSWWAPNGAGYVCSIDEAGQYTGADCLGRRALDVPWPVEYVLARVVRHVRIDNQAFDRRDYKPGPR